MEFSEMTVKELRGFAEEQGIDLEGLHLKQEIVDHLEELSELPEEEPKEAEGGEVSFSKLVQAAKLDPRRRQGAGTPGASDSVRIVKHSLAEEGLLDHGLKDSDSFMQAAVYAYRDWQKAAGKANGSGIPDRDSLEKLGERHSFSVVD